MSDIGKISKASTLAFYRVINDLNITDELKSILLLKFYDEFEMVAYMNIDYLDEMELTIYNKYYNYDDRFKLYFDDIYEGYKKEYGNKIDWVMALSKLNSLQLDIQRNNLDNKAVIG